MPNVVSSRHRPNLAQRKQQFVRAEASAAILELVLDRGFENVTADDMVEVTGLSRRTFFRYFDSKEDVLFVTMEQVGAEIADTIGTRPAHESVWDALRESLMAVVGGRTADDRSKRLSRLLFETPALRARHLDKQDRWQELMAEQVARRLGVRANDGLARLYAALALAALDTAIKEWHNSQRPLTTLIDQAFESARSAMGPALKTSVGLPVPSRQPVRRRRTVRGRRIKP